MGEEKKEETLVDYCQDVRTEMLAIEKSIKTTKSNVMKKDAVLPEGSDKPEIIANLTLAYRHLEDARMRLGKVIQSHEGGKSIYDK